MNGPEECLGGGGNSLAFATRAALALAIGGGLTARPDPPLALPGYAFWGTGTEESDKFAFGFALDVNARFLAASRTRAAASSARRISSEVFGGMIEGERDKDHDLDFASDDEIALEPQKTLASQE